MMASRPTHPVLAATIEAIAAPRWRPESVRAHLDQLTKPPGSLGQLEDLAERIGTVYGDSPGPFGDVVVFVLASDHGVAQRGVSAYPPEVTAQMCANFSAGGAAINVLARNCGASVVVVDMGVAADLTDVPHLVPRKIRPGTWDLSKGPAMTLDEAQRALATGIDLVAQADPTPDLVAVGEMGIGNTTSASAITACLVGESPARLVGAGTGIDVGRLERKRSIVEGAVARVVDPSDPLEVLRQVGGFEIAGMAGVMLGAARKGKAIIVDGFISTSAALIAAALCPRVTGYLIASHRSTEPGHDVALAHLELSPLLDLRLRLGEGTGAALAIPLAHGAAAILREMATFESAGISGATGNAPVGAVVS